MLYTAHIIRAAFSFVFALLGLAGIFVLLGAELMAVVQILIYSGGVIILLVFSIMLTKRRGGKRLLAFNKNEVFASIVTLALAFALGLQYYQTDLEREVLPTASNQVGAIGVAFLTDHLIAFEVVAYLLLVALVGAAYLAKKSENL